MIERRLALEVEHRVHDVLERPRARDAAALGDVPDQEHGRAGFLGEAHQPRRALAHLADVAGRALERLGVGRLDRVDEAGRARRGAGVVQDRLERWSRPARAPAPASPPSRSARSRSCSGDSSPETYSVRTPAPARAAPPPAAAGWTCRCPGSPPTSTREPGTMPPPSTKSNSARPVRQRAISAPRDVGQADGRTGGCAPPARPTDPPAPTVSPTGSSASVFHAPHASQRPAHLGCSAPHSVQRNTERA